MKRQILILYFPQKTTSHNISNFIEKTYFMKKNYFTNINRNFLLLKYQRLLFLNLLEYMQTEKLNRQLQRQLKSAIVNFKSNELQPLLKKFQDLSKIATLVSYQNKGPACTECTIKYYTITSSGFGRMENQAFNNAIRNFFDSLISQNIQIENLKLALKLASQENDDSKKGKLIGQIHLNKNSEKTTKLNNETLDLDTELDFSAIQNCCDGQTQKNGKKCGCIYSEVFQHNKKQIKNLSARIKLLSQENRVLKELLLKNFCPKNPSLKNSESKLKSSICQVLDQQQEYYTSPSKENKLNLSNY